MSAENETESTSNKPEPFRDFINQELEMPELMLWVGTTAFHSFVNGLKIKPVTEEERERLKVGPDGTPIAEDAKALTDAFLKELITRLSNHTLYGKQWDIISRWGVNENSAALVVANAHGVRVMVFAAQSEPLPVPKEYEAMWKFNPDLTRDLGHAYTVYQTRSDSGTTIKDSAQKKSKCIPWIDMGIELAKELAKS